MMQRGHRHAGGFTWDDSHERRHFGLDLAAYVAIGTAVAAAAGTVATYEAGQQQANAAKYNRKLAENQAALASQQADLDAQALQEKQRHELAALTAEQAGMGVETSEGSPLLARSYTASQMQRDVYLTKYGGYVRSAGYEQQAGLQGQYARSYQTAANVGAGVSLLSGAAQVGGAYQYGRYAQQYYQSRQG